MGNIKKFEDFLDKMRGLLDNAKKGHIIVRVEDIENTFPELKGIEDEEIREEIINYFECRSKEEPTRKDIHNKWIAWLEKQSIQQIRTGLEWVNTIDDACDKRYSEEYAQGEYCHKQSFKWGFQEGVDWLEKQGEHKLADKIEPKFNFSVGQWIVATGKCVYLITKIDGFNVTLVDVDGNEYVFDTSSLEDAHLWTIQDAKDSDVLCGYPDADYPWIGIFHNLNTEGGFSSYCYLQAGQRGKFCPPSGENIFGRRNVDSHSPKVVPATKEQRDTFERAMADAGYTFNFESKELKKLSQSEVTKMSDQEEIAEIPFGAKDSELQEATYFIPKGFHAEIDDDKVVIKKDEKPTAWTEEDNMMIEETLYFLREYHHSNRCKNEGDMQKSVTCREWLKSLKQRIGG